MTAEVGEHGPTLGQLAQRKTEWLVTNMVARGSITGITGPTDAGKSILCCALTADVAGGPRFDGGARRLVGPCLWYTSEEDPCTMIRPRLLAAGCPVDGCRFPQHDAQGVLQHPQRLPTQFPQIMRAVQATGAGLVVIDPPTAVMEPSLNPNLQVDVEVVMKGLIHLAASQNVAVAIVLQLNKRQGGSTTEKVGGSGKWVQMCRAVLRLGFHPSKRECRLLTYGRWSHGQRPPSREFQIETWEGEPRFVLGNGNDLADTDAGVSDLDTYQWEEQMDATEWLRQFLADGRQPAQLTWERWQKAGYGRNQWWRVRKELKICVERKNGGPGGEVYLSLPENHTEEPSHPSV